MELSFVRLASSIFREIGKCLIRGLVDIVEGFVDSGENIERRRSDYFCVAIAMVSERS